MSLRGVNDDGRRFLQELPTHRRKDYARVSTSITHRPDQWRDRRLVDGARDLTVGHRGGRPAGLAVDHPDQGRGRGGRVLGRARYQRAAGCAAARPGSRNGYCDSTIEESIAMGCRGFVVCGGASRPAVPGHAPAHRPPGRGRRLPGAGLALNGAGGLSRLYHDDSPGYGGFGSRILRVSLAKLTR